MESPDLENRCSLRIITENMWRVQRRPQLWALCAVSEGIRCRWRIIKKRSYWWRGILCWLITPAKGNAHKFNKRPRAEPWGTPQEWHHSWRNIYKGLSRSKTDLMDRHRSEASRADTQSKRTRTTAMGLFQQLQQHLILQMWTCLLQLWDSETWLCFIQYRWHQSS